MLFKILYNKNSFKLFILLLIKMEFFFLFSKSAAIESKLHLSVNNKY